MVTSVTPWPSGLAYRGLVANARTAGSTKSVQLYPGQKKEAAILLPWEVPVSGSFYPIIAMFWGRRGQGKTLSMTAVGAMMLQRYLWAGIKSSAANPDGHKICANYHVSFADFYNPMLVDMLVDFPPWAHHMTCLVDEILAYFPNRRSLARGNLNFGTFLQQIRKRKIELLFTTQFPQNMDKIMVEQVDLFIRPEIYNRGNSVRLIIHDWWGQFTGNMWTKKWPPIFEPPDWIIPIHGIKNVYGAYPTEEVVAPMWSGNRMEIVNQQWTEEELASQRTNPPGKEGGPLEVAPNSAINPEHDRAVRSVEELILRQGDEFFTDEIIDTAKILDGTIKQTADMHRALALHGYTIMRVGRRFLATKNTSSE